MPYQGFDISGKVCLVTGGTSGIGRAIALGCRDAGAKVVAGSSSPDKVAAIKEELGSGGHQAIQIDVASQASVQAAIDLAIRSFGRLDCVVNAAGIIKRLPTIDFPLEEFERIVRVNLTGTFIVNQLAARAMREQPADERNLRGSIVNIASLTSFCAFEGVSAYAASKGGVLSLTRVFANDVAQYGIRVNAIAPGVFPTDFNKKLIEGTPRGEWLKKHTPLDRFGNAEELVGAAIYLMSPAGSFTNGETIIVDGGFLARGVGV
jgi:NAD(P)-dependent dehydrogenase (short-subunit alcohol dehydrogenase family)